MKPLRKRIIAALDEIETVSKRTERDFQRYESMDTSGDMRRAHNLHMDGLRDAWRILNDFGAAPDDFEALLQLQKAKPKEFAAFMLWVKEEIERPAPAEQAEAA